ncbi:SH3 and PX-domain-containing 3 [Favolaschia claudopus]|uniref:SH3 and PX-domain-containing 3 n=1 Tax=Favolaschia claudopus TaxID=2862362 RepID=A0AAW0CZL1_9AGAR
MNTRRTGTRRMSRPQTACIRFGLVCLAFVIYLWICGHWHHRSTKWEILVDGLAESLGHPNFLNIRVYERDLPQHSLPKFLYGGTERPRYVFFANAVNGLGWNNVLQEQLLNAHLAHLSQRAYVFPDFAPSDHPPFPDKLVNGSRHLLHIPMNALLSGPTAGGGLSSDGKDDLSRRAVSEKWWDVACPRSEVVVLNVQQTMREMSLDAASDGKEILTKWVQKLASISDPCVSVEDGSVFDYELFNSDRLLSIWPSYSQSPILENFAWSPLITAAIFRNFHLFSADPPPDFLTPHEGNRPHGFTNFLPLPVSEQPIFGLLAIHVRRGDYEAQCKLLANSSADFCGWNALGTLDYPLHPSKYALGPQIPTQLDISDAEWREGGTLHHCWPSPESIVARLHTVRRDAILMRGQKLQKLYIATNGDSVWLRNLVQMLVADGWDNVSSSFDMELELEERAVAQAVDMAVLTAAEVFIGNGFSSMTSNVVQTRLAGGRDRRTINFW